MKFVYEPGPGEPDMIKMFGYLFEAGKPTDVDDEDGRVVAKLQGNPFFHGDKDKARSSDATTGLSEADQKLEKALDGRTKAAREARQKAVEAEADAAAKERAAEQVAALKEAEADREAARLAVTAKT